MLSITQIPPVTEHALSLTAGEFEALTVTEQFKRSFSPGNRLGLLIGTAIGGFVPTASYVLVHGEAALKSWLVVLVLGALIFSALSVYQWAHAAFQSGLKAAGFCILTEGTMVLSHTQWLALAALAILILINVCSCSCALQIGQQADRDVMPVPSAATPSVTPSLVVNVAQQNVTAPRQRTSRTDAERKAADARRARQYRARKKSHAIASQTA